MAKAKAKAQEAEEIEDEDTEDEEDLELEDLDEDVEEDAPAKSKKGGSKQPAVEFGVADLAKHLSAKTGKEISTRDLRTQIRRMVRDGSGRVDREITAGNRTRYDWEGGLKNPEVKAIIKAVLAGELEAGKKQALDELKAKKAKQKAEAAKAETKSGSKSKGKKGKAKPAPVVEDDDDDDDDEDDDE